MDLLADAMGDIVHTNRAGRAAYKDDCDRHDTQLG
jgi:hypothetical protein